LGGLTVGQWEHTLFKVKPLNKPVNRAINAVHNKL